VGQDQGAGAQGGQGGATGTAEQAKQTAQQTAQRAATEGRNRVRQQIDQRSTDAGERLRSTGSDLRSVGEELRKQGKEQPARMADQVAERVERAGGYLRESDADRVLRDVEDFGRRQPLAMLAGGLALGFLASRFLKASSARRFGDYQRGIAAPQPLQGHNGYSEHSQRFEPHAG
jgi:glucan phosphorylase